MNKTAVIFIHGFTGGPDTWLNSNQDSFKSLLESYSELSDVYFHEFVYHTQIINIKNNRASKIVAGILNKLLHQKLQINTPVVKKNTPISEIAHELSTFIKYNLNDYTNLIFVCHSMGGLIAKKIIIDVIENDLPIEQDIIGYCSLATPHRGSIPSILMSPFNINAKEMAPLNKDNSILNDKWVEHINQVDKTLYVKAKSDEVVNESSSSPNIDIKKFPVDVVEADHTSICKPNLKTDIICKVVRKFILDCLDRASIKNMCLEDFEEEISSYDKETFVIKLVLANVEELLVDDAKDSFLMAEILEKQASKAERIKIKELTVRIVSTYKTLAGSGTKKSSSELVSEVHEKIIDTDKQALDCAIKNLSFMHKKGFLHKKANKSNLKINWSNSVTLDDIEKYRNAIRD